MLLKPDQQRLITCALALGFNVGGEIETLCGLLDDLGICVVDPQNLIAMRHSP